MQYLEQSGQLPSFAILDREFKDTAGRKYYYELTSENSCDVTVEVSNSHDVGGLSYAYHVSYEIDAETGNGRKTGNGIIEVELLGVFDHNGDPYEEPSDSEESSTPVGPIYLTLEELSDLLNSLYEPPSEMGLGESNDVPQKADDEFAIGYKYNQEYRCLCNGADFKQVWEDLSSETFRGIISELNGTSYWMNFASCDDTFCLIDKSPFMWVNDCPILPVSTDALVASTGRTATETPSPYEEHPAGYTPPKGEVIIFGCEIDIEEIEYPQPVLACGTDDDIMFKLIRYKVIEEAEGEGGDSGEDPNIK